MAAAEIPPGTRERILDTAERLFLEKGFRGASLRALTKQASVNLAAVGYHFGGKDELLRAVLERRVAPVNQERLRRLDALEAGWRGGRARTLEPVLEALLEPAFDALRSIPDVRDIATLLFSEPHTEMPVHIERLFGECSRRFDAALAVVLGRGDANRRALRFQIVIGAMLHFLAGRHRVAATLTGIDSEALDHGLVAELTSFFAAGLRATARTKPRARRVPRTQEIRR